MESVRGLKGNVSNLVEHRPVTRASCCGFVIGVKFRMVL
jgi:hypothetical protein